MDRRAQLFQVGFMRLVSDLGALGLVSDQQLLGALAASLTNVLQIEVNADNFESAQQLIGMLEPCKTCGEAVDLLNAVPLRGQAADDVTVLARSIRKVDMNAAGIAWRREYVCNGYQVCIDFVAERLRSYAVEWDPAKKYVPLAAVLQSSGWGKSRLMCELWRRDMYVVYISCLGETRTGFPPRTQGLAQIIESSNVTSIIRLLSSIMTVLHNRHHADMELAEEGEAAACREWIQLQMSSDNDLVTEILKEFNAIEVPIISGEGKELDEYLSECEQTYGKLLRPKLQELSGKFLLLCVDEAGELSSPKFAAFRRALRCIPVTSCFFSLVLGTDMKVADLAAALDEDPSTRVRLMSKSDWLYDPICMIGSSDVLVGNCERVETTPEHVLRFGRPLWASYMDSLSQLVPEVVQPTILLAQKKLLGRDVDFFTEPWVTREVAVSVFACLIGIDVVSWSTLAQDMAARHMRTIVKISKDRRRVFTASAAEPALACAAAELLHKHNDKYLCDFLTRLIEVFVDGLVLEGVRGEVAVKIVLLLAMHKLTKSCGYIKPVKLRDYLVVLYGEASVKELEKSCGDFSTAVLFFNCFLPTAMEPSDALCLEYYKRNAAVTCKRNEKNVDLLLPVRDSRELEGCEPVSQEKGKRELSTKSSLLGGGGSAKMSPGRTPGCSLGEGGQKTRGALLNHGSILGQVKNIRNPTNLNTALEKLDCEDRVQQLVSFLIQAGARGMEVNVENNVLVAKGMEFEFITNPKVRELLKTLVQTCEDVFKGASEQEKTILGNLVPLAYRQHKQPEEEQVPKKQRRQPPAED